MDIEIEDENQNNENNGGFIYRNDIGVVNRALIQDIPTTEEEVLERLKELGYPTIIHGESAEDRRRRLETIILTLREKNDGQRGDAKAETHSSELWYHEGSNDLILTRLYIAYDSICRVQKRLEAEKEITKIPEFQKAAKFQDLQRRFNAFEYKSSQLGDDRPLTFCQISPNGLHLATASRSGVCKLWELDSLKLIRSFKGHGEHAGALIFHPSLYESESHSVVQLASCCSAGYVFLWNKNREDPIMKLSEHNHRVSRVVFHPTGKFLASACFDKSWRLFDIERNIEILHQEGHSRECFNLAFHPDGSLAASVGFDARALIWDLRTGHCVLPLDGHLKKVVAVDFASDGFFLATGSEDQKIIIWDIRAQKPYNTIAAHNSLVSHVKFHDGCLITCSFDKSCRVWSHPGWYPLKSLVGHEQKLSCVDITPDQKTIVTSSFDRTFKIWS